MEVFHDLRQQFKCEISDLGHMDLTCTKVGIGIVFKGTGI